MLLPGRLSSTSLGDVLGALHRAELTGILELSELGAPPRAVPGRRHAVHLACGLVVRVETSCPVPTLGQLLQARGLLTSGARAFLDASARLPERSLVGVLLVRHRLVPEEAVNTALADQLRMRLDALFGLEDARIAFRVARDRLDRTAPQLRAREYLPGRPRARERGAPVGRPAPAPFRTPPERVRALALLGLGERATTEDVRRAFRRAARELHPDRPGDRELERTKRLAELSAAYHVLLT